mgnify:FL=1
MPARSLAGVSLQVVASGLALLTSLETAHAAVPISGMQVRVIKRNEAHLRTAAMLCALQEHHAPATQIEAAWRSELSSPTSIDDQVLVRLSMTQLCPGVAMPPPGSTSENAPNR